MYIPEDLAQRKLPSSFLYYDPILKIVDSLINPKTKNFYNTKMQLRMNSLRDRDYYIRNILAKVGINYDEADNAVVREKLSFKPTILDANHEIKCVGSH